MENYIQEKNHSTSKPIEIKEEDLFLIIKEAYRNGYASYDMTEAGLEPYDPDGYSRWVMQKLKGK